MPFRRDKAPQQPMVVVAFFVVAGLIVGWFVSVALWVVLVSALLLGVLYYVMRWSLVLALVMFSIGIMTTTVWRSSGESLDGRSEYLSIRIGARNRAYIEAYRDGSNGWRSVRQLFYYGADSTLSLSPGDHILAYCRVKEFRGSGYVYISERSMSHNNSMQPLAYRINSWASGRLSALGLSGDALSLVNATLLGRRDMLRRELSDSYNLSGTSHVLALSGLHLVIIFMILNLFFGLFHLLPYGHIIRSVLVVVVMWGYVVVVGMSASVVRAATMLTLLQSAHLLHRRTSTLNALSVAIMVMSLLNPSILFDAGFQLSVVALFAIVMWAVPLIDRVMLRRESDLLNFAVNSLLSLSIVGLVCTVALMPLVSYLFGYVSLWGVVINPLVVTTTYLLLIASFVWVLFGFGLLALPLSYFIDTLAQFQNYVVGSVAAAYVLRFDLWEMCAIYLMYILITLIARR